MRKFGGHEGRDAQNAAANGSTHADRDAETDPEDPE
jgi:hypothetical protein